MKCFKSALLVVSLAAMPVDAHHSAAAFYDLSRQVTLEGTISELKLINPHARIVFDVQGAKGVEQWTAVGDAASTLRRNGWSADTLKKGMKITISGNPARDGSKSMEWQRIQLPDGKELLGGNGGRIERERALERLEQSNKAAPAPAP